jgi:hypothetical protein
MLMMTNIIITLRINCVHIGEAPIGLYNIIRGNILSPLGGAIYPVLYYVGLGHVKLT